MCGRANFDRAIIWMTLHWKRSSVMSRSVSLTKSLTMYCFAALLTRTFIRPNLLHRSVQSFVRGDTGWSHTSSHDRQQPSGNSRAWQDLKGAEDIDDFLFQSSSSYPRHRVALEAGIRWWYQHLLLPLTPRLSAQSQNYVLLARVHLTQSVSWILTLHQ